MDNAPTDPCVHTHIYIYIHVAHHLPVFLVITPVYFLIRPPSLPPSLFPRFYSKFARDQRPNIISEAGADRCWTLAATSVTWSRRTRQTQNLLSSFRDKLLSSSFPWSVCFEKFSNCIRAHTWGKVYREKRGGVEVDPASSRIRFSIFEKR